MPPDRACNVQGNDPPRRASVPPTEQLPDIDPADGSTVTRYTYAPCAQGSEPNRRINSCANSG